MPTIKCYICGANYNAHAKTAKTCNKVECKREMKQQYEVKRRAKRQTPQLTGSIFDFVVNHPTQQRDLWVRPC